MNESLEQFMTSVSKAIDPIFMVMGQILPMYHIICPMGETVLPAPRVDKDLGVAIMRELLKKVEATRVCFVDEAWTVTRQGSVDDADQLMLQPPPSEQPDRKEIVLLMVEDAEAGELMGYRDIIREHGEPARLGPLVIHERTTMTTGRMVGLLPKPAGAKVQ